MPFATVLPSVGHEKYGTQGFVKWNKFLPHGIESLAV